MRSAKFSKAAYMVGETNGLTENSRKKVAALLDGTGFEIVPDLTHRDISTFHDPTHHTTTDRAVRDPSPAPPASKQAQRLGRT